MSRPAPIELIVLASLVASAASAAPRGPLVPRSDKPQLCEHPSGGDVEGEVTLDRDCVYEHAFNIRASNTTLDCNGAVITNAKGRAIRVEGEIENVTVRNCYVEQTPGLWVGPTKRQEGETEEAMRERAPRNVVIEHVATSGTTSTGVFLGPCAVDTTVRKSIVEGATSAGIYLEYGTQGAVVRDNLIRRNGFFTGEGFPRLGWTQREGVAVDGAAHCVIEGNELVDNAFGGVFLYKNCWEHHSTDDKSPQRIQHAHSNVIRGNTFRDQPFGVWVAARQARDLGAWDCGDPTPYENPIPIAEAFPDDYPTFRGTFPAPYEYLVEYLVSDRMGWRCADDDCSPARTALYLWPDFAADNTIEDNHFEGIELAGVRVEDDRTRVTGNLFVGDFEYVYVGTPFRSRYLDHPVTATVIRDNAYAEAAPKSEGFADQLALVPGEHRGTVVEDNVAACRAADGGWSRDPSDCDAGPTAPADGGPDAPRPIPGDSPPPPPSSDNDGCTLASGTSPAPPTTGLLLLLLAGARLSRRRGARCQRRGLRRRP